MSVAKILTLLTAILATHNHILKASNQQHFYHNIMLQGPVAQIPLRMYTATQNITSLNEYESGK